MFDGESPPRMKTQKFKAYLQQQQKQITSLKITMAAAFWIPV